MPSYLELVESQFLASVKKGLSLRSGDVEIVRDWERRGVPIDVVSRGILHGIRRFLADSEPTAPVPSGLRYYRSAVEREFEIWQRAAARGTASATTAREPATKPGVSLQEKARAELLDRLSRADESCRETYLKALSFFDMSVKDTPLADLLFQVEDMLVTGLGQSLGPETFKAITVDVDRNVEKAAQRGVGRRAIEDLRRNLLRKAVAESVGFHSFLEAVLKKT